jgi:hypothetical protein
MYSGDAPSQDESVPVADGAVPANGMVGETTAAAADRAKHELYRQDENPHAIAVTDGALPPPPAQQLAPIMHGGGDMVSGQPAAQPSAVVPYEASGAGGLPLPQVPAPAPAGQ